MVSYNVNGQPQGQPMVPQQSQGQPMMPQQPQGQPMMQPAQQPVNTVPDTAPLKSQLAKGVLGFLVNLGVNMEAVDLQEDTDTTSIIFVEADNLGGKYLTIVTIDNKDDSWSVLVKKPMNISAMSRPKVLEFVNGLNEDSFMITSFLIGGTEPGLIARLDREANDIASLISDIKVTLDYAENQFNVRI